MATVTKRVRSDGTGHGVEMAFFRHERVPFFGGIGVEGGEKSECRTFSFHPPHTTPKKPRSG